MSKTVKALSVILILAALFGLVGSGLAAKDALDSKSYYEKKGEETDANFAKLDDGINQLEENDKTYQEGKATYDDGMKQYEEGKKQLADAAEQIADGEKTLEENREAYEKGKVAYANGQKELQAGRAKLAEGERTYRNGQAELAAGEQKLAQAKQLLAGLNDLQSGFATWEQGYNGLQQLGGQAGLDAPSKDNTAQYDAAIAGSKQQVEGGLQQANAKLEELNGQKAQLEAGIAQMKEAGQDTTEMEQTLAAVNAGIQQCNDTITQLNTTKANLEALTGAPTAVAQGQQKLASGLGTAMNGVLADAATAEKVAQASGMSADQIKATVQALPGMDYATFDQTMKQFMGLATALGADVQKQITDGEAQLAAGRQALAAGAQELAKGRRDLAAGEAQLADGAKQLKEFEDGEATLADAKEQYAEGEKTLKDAEKQLADGEEQLKVFEDGRAALIDGLNIVMVQEDEGITSVADRLDKGFTFMRDDTDIDYDAARKVVEAGRGFSSDSGEKISSEIWTRVYSTAAALVGSLLALVAGILGLKSKFKGSGVTSLITAVLGAGGLGGLLAAGSKYSEQAGASAVTLVLAAAGILACAALLNGIASFAANKKAKV